MGATKSSGQVSQDRLELAAIAETLSDPIVATTLDGKIHSWNAAAEQLFGYRAEESSGSRAACSTHLSVLGEIEEHLRALA